MHCLGSLSNDSHHGSIGLPKLPEAASVTVSASKLESLLTYLKYSPLHPFYSRTTSGTKICTSKGLLEKQN